MRKIYSLLLLLAIIVSGVSVIAGDCAGVPGGDCLAPKWATCYSLTGDDCEEMYEDAHNICLGGCLPAGYVEYCWECHELFFGIYVGKLFYACELS